MVKVGWLADSFGIIGGAEISDSIFIAHASQDVEVVRCPPSKRPPADVDIFVLGNVITYGKRWIEVLETKPVVMHIHDLWPYGSPVLRRWILNNAKLVMFNSPKQWDMFHYQVNVPKAYIHIPVDMEGITKTVKEYDGERKGIIWLGRIEAGKGIQYAVDWSLCNDKRIDLYGQMNDPHIRIVPPCYYCGQIAHRDVPGLLAQYETFWYASVLGDLYCRSVVEAAAAGLKMVLVGDTQALWDWLDFQASQDAPDTFWSFITGVAHG